MESMSRSDPTRKAGPPEPGAPWHAPQFEEVQRLIKKHTMLKKLNTTYSFEVSRGDSCEYPEHYCFVASEEVKNHVSVCSLQACDGILRHWGTPKDLIAELKQVIEVLENYSEKVAPKEDVTKIATEV